MENRKSIIFFQIIIFLGGFFSPHISNAYPADTTHRGLTDEIVDLFNHHYPDLKIGDTDKEFIKNGAVEEDAPAHRVINHFYDPVHNIGFKSVNPTSKVWATATVYQAAFGGDVAVGKTKGLFTGESDYSWERSIYEYAHGDRERGLVGLGHILHLLEDASVPDHTRNDAHPPAFDWGSPYEAFTHKFNEINIEIARNIKPIIFTSLGEYFDNLANYSNNNFFSKDTILSNKYLLPNIDIQKEIFINNRQSRVAINSLGIPLVIVEKNFNDKGILFESYSLSAYPEEPILTAYWNDLSKQAITHGAGLIKLFFDEVEKEKQTLALLEKNKSWVSRQLAQVQNGIANVFSFFQNTPQEANVVPLEITENVEQENPQTEIVEEVIVPEIVTPPTEIPIPVVEQVIEPVETEIVETVVLESEPVEWKIPEQKLVPLSSPGFGGGGAPPEETPAVSTPPPPSAPVILSPSNSSSFSTSSITFSGSGVASTTISQNINSTTAEVDGVGNWALSLESLSEGTTTIRFFATDSNGTSDAAEVSFFVDTLAPTIPTFSITGCEYDGSNTCMSFSGSINVEWTSLSSDVVLAKVFSNDTFLTSSNASPITISPSSGNNTFEVVVNDALGNTSTSTGITLAFARTGPALSFGYYCAPYTATYVEGQSYTPTDGNQCSYISPNLSGNRYGDVYRGTLMNATLVNGHFLSIAADSVQNFDLPADPVNGENFFSVVYEVHHPTDDVPSFRSFFQTGDNPPPHLNYGIINWKYSTTTP